MNDIHQTEALPDPAGYVVSVVKGSGSSFYWAMRLLPREKRRAMFSVYAFCREVDDIADEPGEFDAKMLQLGQWRGEIERLYGGQPRFPVARALVLPIERFELRREDFLAVIDGMEMDAREAFRIADMDELTLYCDRVACAVGRLSNRVFGLRDERCDALAFALGQALQLTNILRDISEDAERGRLYLPADLLMAYDITEEDLPAILKNPAIGKVCDMLAAVADNRFNQARDILATCDRRQMRPAIMMMQAYRKILELLLERGWRNLDTPAKVPRLAKAWIVLRYGIL
jgi:squalene synthase HpnD